MAKREFFSKNIVTTISGIILLIVTILVSVGLLTTEQGAELQTQLGVVVTAGSQIIAAIGALILIFKAKD